MKRRIHTGKTSPTRTGFIPFVFMSTPRSGRYAIVTLRLSPSKSRAGKDTSVLESALSIMITHSSPTHAIGAWFTGITVNVSVTTRDIGAMRNSPFFFHNIGRPLDGSAIQPSEARAAKRAAMYKTLHVPEKVGEISVRRDAGTWLGADIDGMRIKRVVFGDTVV